MAEEPLIVKKWMALTSLVFVLVLPHVDFIENQTTPYGAIMLKNELQ